MIRTQKNKFVRYAWAVLAYNIFVILFGAFVRATGSGAGCGAHWPLCNGVVIPRAPAIETIIEYTHRVTSGIALILVIALVVWAWRGYPPRSSVRRLAGVSLFFTLTEALIGAGLVLFELVAHNASMIRAFSMMAHLANTFLLMGALASTVWCAALTRVFRWPRRVDGGLYWVGVLGMLLMGASGAIAALGDTLFPATSFVEGLMQDFTAEHILLRLRVLHPMIAILAGAYAVWLGNRFKQKQTGGFTGLFAVALATVYVIQLGLGALNVILLAPVWMQLVHLFSAVVVWLAYVFLGLAYFSEPWNESIQGRAEV